MSELRFDPIQKQWVIIAPERERRIVKPEKIYKNSGYCPFCPGNEDKHSHAIRIVRQHDNQGSSNQGSSNQDSSNQDSSNQDSSNQNLENWKIKVIANKFPALKVEGDLNREAVGIYDRMDGVGAHEIIIETPEHDKHLADLSIDHLSCVLGVYRERLEDLMKDLRLRYVLLFRNHGGLGGTTVEHPHSQLIAMPVIPHVIATELRSAKDHFNIKERCIFCDIIAQEISDAERVITINEHFIAFCPYASRVPFEVQIMPRRHSHDFRLSGPELLKQLAGTLKEVLLKIKTGLDDPPYNLLLHTTPNTSGGGSTRAGYWQTIADDFHWHLEIIPHPPQLAGFEMGTGLSINPTSPEKAAKFLRGVV